MNSYGGFLPLELNKGFEYFEEYGDNVLRYNSGKAAIVDVINHVCPTKVYVPCYYCPSTTMAIIKSGCEVAFYHLTPDLIPERIPDRKGEMVLLVDYFGVKTDAVDELAGSFHEASVLVDKCHAFFSKPVLRDRAFNIYSAKKFIGVPDGAYLIAQDVNWKEPKRTFSHDYSGFLIMAYEEGTNSAYKLKKDADLIIAQNPGGMSVLAEGILRGIDYGFIKEQRKSNYSVLQGELSTINSLSLPDVCCPYHYPLLIKEKGRALKKELVEDKIFVPTLWGDIELPFRRNKFEEEMSEDCVFLPLDQRYDEKDMKYIIGKIIKSIIK